MKAKDRKGVDGVMNELYQKQQNIIKLEYYQRTITLPQPLIQISNLIIYQTIMLVWLPSLAFVSLTCYFSYQKYRSARRLTLKTASISNKLPSFIQTDSYLQSILSQPFFDLFRRGGKRIRILLTQSIAQICAPTEKIMEEKQEMIDGICILIESLHNASLIIDDIEDNSKIRRDEPVVHLKFGVKKSIISANFVYFKVMNQLIKTITEQHRLGIMKIFAEEMVVCHLGQSDDLFSPLTIRGGQFKAQSFTEEDYMRMVISKTGALLRMMVKMVCEVLGTEQAIRDKLIRIVEGTGAAFQIYDDYLNLKGNLKKGGVCEDIVERKLTLMVVHSLRVQGDPDFLNLFMKSDKSAEEIEQVLKRMQRNGSFQYAFEKMGLCAREVLALAEQLPNTPKRDVLFLILNKVIYR